MKEREGKETVSSRYAGTTAFDVNWSFIELAVQLIRISNRWPGVTLQLGVSRGLCAIVSKKNDLAPTERSINDANRKIPLRDFGRDRIQGARDIEGRKMNRRKFHWIEF